jgi:hypothetical protein
VPGTVVDIVAVVEVEVEVAGRVVVVDETGVMGEGDGEARQEKFLWPGSQHSQMVQ